MLLKHIQAISPLEVRTSLKLQSFSFGKTPDDDHYCSRQHEHGWHTLWDQECGLSPVVSFMTLGAETAMSKPASASPPRPSNSVQKERETDAAAFEGGVQLREMPDNILVALRLISNAHGTRHARITNRVRVYGLERKLGTL